MIIEHKKRYTHKGLFLVISICIISIISTIIIISDPKRPIEFEYLPFLPIAFGITSLIFIKLMSKCFNNLAVALIVGGYFIRNVVGPLLLPLGNYESMFNINSVASVNYAIVLMIYEVFFVFLILLVYINRKENRLIFINHTITNIDKPVTSKVFKIIFWSIIAYIVFILLYIPEVKMLYTSIFSDKNITEVVYDYDSIVERGGIKRPLMTLFVLAVAFMRYFIPSYFMIKIRNKVGEKTIGLIYSIPFVLLHLLIVGSTNAEVIFGILVSAILLSILYPTKRKLIINFFILLGIIAFIYILVLKINAFGNWTGSNGFGTLTEVVQSYFPGIINIAAGINIENENKLKTLFFDIYSTIPFRESFFSLEDYRLVLLFNMQNGVAGQILPFIIQSSHYLGFILGPILPAVFAFIAVKLSYIINKQQNIWKVISFSFLLVLFSITPTMYNFTISLSQFFNIFIPLILISKIEGKVKL